MSPLTLDELAQPCTRCTHQRAVHTGGAKRWGWAIYEPIWPHTPAVAHA
jgi:hypothetical protein